MHTDHANLTFKNFTLERVLCWCLYCEEYGPILKYVPGEQNVVADALSRLELEQLPFLVEKDAYYTIFDSYDTECQENIHVHPLTY